MTALPDEECLSHLTRGLSSVIATSRSLSHDRVLVGLAATTLVATGWLLLGPFPVVASWLVQVGLDGVLILTAWRVAELVGDLPPVRRFWRAVAVAGVLFSLGDTLQTGLVIRDPGTDPSSSTPQIILVANRAVRCRGRAQRRPDRPGYLHQLAARRRRRRARGAVSSACCPASCSRPRRASRNARCAASRACWPGADNGHLSPRAWGAVIGVVVSTALVVLRQLIAFSDNARLLTRLDASMLELRRQEERFRSLVQHASDITMVTTPQGGIVYGSPALDRVLGPRDPRGEFLAIMHPDDQQAGQNLIGQLLDQPAATVTVQLRARHADGAWRWLEVIGTNLLDNAAVGGLVLNARDVNDVRQFQDRLRFQATHDNLTQLPNRALFHERLRLASLTHGPGAAQASIIAIDLDDFKQVNDTLGHHAGDALLVAVADRLNRCVRPSDTVARLGGDEFAVVLPEAGRDGAFAVADRTMGAFADPLLVEGHLLHIKASLGIAVGSTDDADSLLREADAAMYAAKHGGKGGFVFADAVSR